MAESSHAEEHAGDPSQRVGPQIGRLLAGLCVLFALLYFVARGGNFSTARPALSQIGNVVSASDGNAARCGPNRADGRPIDFSMLFGTDKRTWIELSADRFARLCPNIQVKLAPLDDSDAIPAILSGSAEPGVWSPTDALSLQVLQHRWSLQQERPPLSIVEHTNLLESPLVLLIWEDRLRVLSTLLAREPEPERLWMHLLCPMVSQSPSQADGASVQKPPASWADWYVSLHVDRHSKSAPSDHSASTEVSSLPTLTELQSWGKVKIASPKPTRSTIGAATLYLLASDYLIPSMATQGLLGDSRQATVQVQTQPKEALGIARSVEEEFPKKKDQLKKWLRRCQIGQRTSFVPEQTLAESMFNLGPSEFDAVVTTEPLALRLLDQIDSHQGSGVPLHVVYPNPTIVFRHPAFLFPMDAERQQAAQKWIEFLLSEESQRMAIEQGFRPVHPKGSRLLQESVSHRFLRLRRFGVQVQPQLHEPPAPKGQRMQDLLTLWGDATGRY